MKRFVSCAVVMLMLIALMLAVIPAASATELTASQRVNIASGVYPFADCAMGAASEKNQLTLTDGELGNNKTGDYEFKWANGGEADAFGGKAPAADTTKIEIKMTDGSISEYYYLVQLPLSAPSTVDGFAINVHGYKPEVMDKGFDIIVSTDDGVTWKKVFSATADELFNDASPKTYVGYVKETGAAANAETPSASIAADFDAVENVTYIAYACTAFRDINGYYTARFTEFQVFGKAGETTPAETTTEAITPAETTTEATTPAETTGKATTPAETTNEAPATDATPEATTPAEVVDTPETTPAAVDEGGCGSAIASAMLLAIMPMAAVIIKKK